MTRMEGHRENPVVRALISSVTGPCRSTRTGCAARFSTYKPRHRRYRDWGERIPLIEVKGLSSPLSRPGHHRRCDHDGRRVNEILPVVLYPGRATGFAQCSDYLPDERNIYPRWHRSCRQQIVPRRRSAGAFESAKRYRRAHRRTVTSASTLDLAIIEV